MSRAHFQVVAMLDHAYKPERGTVTIDRRTGVVSIRRHRSRRTFDVPLAAVASMIVRQILTAENRDKRRAVR